MTNVFYLVGLPCTGKTTFRKRVFTNPRFVTISSDDEIESIAKSLDKTYDDVFHSVKFNEIYKSLQKKIDDAILAKKDIVVDMTNLTKNARNRWNLPTSCTRYAIVFEKDKNWRNRLDRRNKITTKKIPPEVINTMWGVYDKPFLSEGFNQVFTIIELCKDDAFNFWKEKVETL